MSSLGMISRTCRTVGIAVSVVAGLALAGCRTVITDDYQAIAVTTYTWRAEYRPQGVTPDRPREGRIETFESNALVNMNGQPTVEPTGDRDARGLWWPAIPPEPTVEDLEARQQDNESFSEPQIHQSVDYRMTFDNEGRTVTLPTHYPVYREAVRAHEARRSLELTLAPLDSFVQRAQMR